MYHNYQATNVCLPPVGGLKHPHLICDEADIEALRTRIKTGRPRALWNRLAANCDLYQDPSSSYYIDIEVRGDELASQVNGFREIIGRKRGKGRGGKEDILLFRLVPGAAAGTDAVFEVKTLCRQFDPTVATVWSPAIHTALPGLQFPFTFSLVYTLFPVSPPNNRLLT